MLARCGALGAAVGTRVLVSTPPCQSDRAGTGYALARSGVNEGPLSTHRRQYY